MAEDEFALRKKLEKMKLHEKIEFGDHLIQRVVGGWIYWRFSGMTVESDKGTSVSSAVAGVFVPEP